jgi:hypothetical protein
MPIRRKFIDWRRPVLPTAAELICHDRVERGRLDLDNVIIGVPTASAARRLLEILVERADSRSLTLLPPRIQTTGTIPELLYDPKRPFASDFAQQLTWVRALKETDRQRLKRVFPTLPNDSDSWAWLALGRMLATLHTELAADAFDFEHVVTRGGELATFNEADRWQVLADVQRKYLSILDGLDLWDKQTARLVAIKQGEFHTDKEIVLVGTVDMNLAQRQILDAVAEHVTAIIAAPQELESRFDSHGCLEPEAWQDVPLGVQTEQIEIVDGPGDQADAIVRAIASWKGKYAADEITIGVADARLVPMVTQRLAECDIRSRYGAGRPIASTGPFQLLQVLADYVETGHYSDFAALVRHPAVTQWLATQLPGDVLSAVDDYHARHLPYRLTGDWPAACAAENPIRAIYAYVDQLVSPWQGAARPLDQWGQVVLDVLIRVYSTQPIDTEEHEGRTIVAACDKIRGVLGDYLELGDDLAPKVEGAQALRLLLEHLRGEMISPPADEAAIELLGWLDLPLDDAPALVIAGFNEGIAPASQNGDLFLPNELRRQLKLNDNDRRYARDAYALSVVAANRQRLKIIAGRRTANNDPLVPSRLLLAGDDETLAKRTLAFFAERKASRRIVLPGGLKAGRKTAAFEVPKPLPLTERVTSMRVTEFKDYLACPYRYYLRHQLGLDAIDDRADELDPAQFGNLVHEAVSIFSVGEHRDSSDRELIAAQLEATLENLVKRDFGHAPLPSVRVQAEQARMRLFAFARWQAEWRMQGWQIQQAEVSPPKRTALLMVDGEPMYLRGRVDRIDYNATVGRYALLDYKTSDSGKTPKETHCKRSGEWIDLQLPLYRHLVEPLGIAGAIDLGYIVLPKTQCECHIAGWSDEELAQADKIAHDVVRKVRNQEFGQPTTPPPAFSEAYAAICQDDQFGARMFADDDEEGAE